MGILAEFATKINVVSTQVDISKLVYWMRYNFTKIYTTRQQGVSHIYRWKIFYTPRTALVGGRGGCDDAADADAPGGAPLAGRDPQAGEAPHELGLSNAQAICLLF